jgi:3-deoxy-manno-octulosonate cytidylyltransferase (CMP-KDO synthetase)
MTRTSLEIAESLEQLRAIEHGCPIAVAIAPEPFPAGVDTAADLARVEALLAGKASS